MKKQDFLFIILVVVVFLPFFLSDAVYDWYKSFNAAHGMVMSFLKFAILSSLAKCWDYESVRECTTGRASVLFRAWWYGAYSVWVSMPL